MLTPVSNTTVTIKTQEPSAQKLDWKQQKEAQAILRKKENDLKKCEEKIDLLERKNVALDEEMTKPEIATNYCKTTGNRKGKRNYRNRTRSTLC